MKYAICCRGDRWILLCLDKVGHFENFSMKASIVSIFYFVVEPTVPTAFITLLLFIVPTVENLFCILLLKVHHKEMTRTSLSPA